MPAPRLPDALRALVPPADAAERDYAPAFAAIAALLFERAVLVAGGVAHRFTELEFYADGRGHRDPFTHGDPRQRAFGRWYFHRSGESYRGGTYKGLDLTFGTDDLAAGVLVRSLARDDGVERIVDGPCKVVDHLLAYNGAHAVAALDARIGDRDLDDPASPLAVTLCELAREVTVHASPRVGLTLKRGDTPARRRFLARDYRFLTEPARVRNGRPQLVVGLHRRGRSVAEIAALTGARAAVVEGYVRAYEAGRAGGAMPPSDDASPAAVCARLGACDAAR